MKVHDNFNKRDIEVDLQVRHYENGNIGLQLWSDEGPYATITTNIGIVPKGHAHIDTNNLPEGIAFLEEYKLGHDTGKRGESGYCTYPLWELDLNKLKEVCINPDELKQDMD